MSCLSPVSKALLGVNLEKFTEIQATGFQAKDVMELVSSWPRVPSEFKLHVVADAVLTHYQQNPEFAEELSATIGSLKGTSKETASYRLGKILSAWLHQQWTSLPCAGLSGRVAYELFPQHALATPTIPQPEKPFVCDYVGRSSYLTKLLRRPLEWEGAMDGFSSLVDQIQQPKNMTVIGFGDARELVILNKKWPSTMIHGYEDPSRDTRIDFSALSSAVSVHYNDYPESYKHTENTVEMVLIRHPNSVGKRWSEIVFKALDALSPNGTLLITFYCEREMLALKKQFLGGETSKFVWSEKVNPFAYNPFFVSYSGTYSFDFFLAAITPKSANQTNILEKFTIGRTRSHEESQIMVKPYLRKFVVSEHDNLSIVSTPGFYEKKHQSTEYGHPQSCFKCSKVSSDYFQTLSRIGGKSLALDHAFFCPEHVPSTKQHWEKTLKEPESGWKDQEPRVYQFIPVVQSIPKTSVSRL